MGTITLFWYIKCVKVNDIISKLSYVDKKSIGKLVRCLAMGVHL